MVDKFLKLLSTMYLRKEMNNKNIFEGPCIDVTGPKGFSKGQRALFRDELVWPAGSTGKIHVSFSDPSSSWSRVGSDSNKYNPSMNLGWVDPPFDSFTIDGMTFTPSDFQSDGQGPKRNFCANNASSISECNENYLPGATILHEFGHGAAGLYHEHQNHISSDGTVDPNPIVFNTTAVYSALWNSWCKDDIMCSPTAKVTLNGQTKCCSTVLTNVIDKYTCIVGGGSSECPSGYWDPETRRCNTACQFSGSNYDPESIMLYAPPSDWIEKGGPLSVNFKYSKTDIEWMAKKYPLNDPSRYPKLDIIFVDGPKWKKYWVKKVVTEGLAPYIGIIFEFYDGSDKMTSSSQLPSIMPSKVPMTPGPVPLVPSGPTASEFPVASGPITSSPATYVPTYFPTEVPTEAPIEITTSKPIVMPYEKTRAPYENTRAPYENTNAPYENTRAPYIKPRKEDSDTLVTEEKKIWKEIFAKVGSMDNYPRPQGKLPMLNWGLTDTAASEMEEYYHGVFSANKFL
jgi:hypothetical protein